mmetsp:Transcript_85339/g.204440  ORF Transcript_85339/g.204440 Transcript_85339/m.204440 type:complete len:221 (+) Transcript_85339:1364-2026(+)
MACSDPPLSDDTADDLLQLLCVRLGAFGAEIFQSLQLPSFQEEPGHSQSPVLFRHVVGQHECFDEGAVPVTLETVRQQAAETRYQFVEDTAVGIPIVHDLDQLNGSTLNDLVQHQIVVEDAALLELVRLEAAYVVQMALVERLQQVFQVGRILLADGAEEHLALLVVSQGPYKVALRAANQLLALDEEAIVVLVQPTLRVVFHLSGIVLDDEALIHGQAC